MVETVPLANPGFGRGPVGRGRGPGQWAGDGLPEAGRTDGKTRPGLLADRLGERVSALGLVPAPGAGTIAGGECRAADRQGVSPATTAIEMLGGEP